MGKKAEVTEGTSKSQRTSILEKLQAANELAIPAHAEEEQIDATSLALIHLPAGEKRNLYKYREGLNEIIEKAQGLHPEWGEALGLSALKLDELLPLVQMRDKIEDVRPRVAGLLDALEDTDDLLAHILADHIAQIAESARFRGKRNPEVLTAYEEILNWWTSSAQKGAQSRKKNKENPPSEN